MKRTIFLLLLLVSLFAKAQTYITDVSQSVTANSSASTAYPVSALSTNAVYILSVYNNYNYDTAWSVSSVSGGCVSWTQIITGKFTNSTGAGHGRWTIFTGIGDGTTTTINITFNGTCHGNIENLSKITGVPLVNNGSGCIRNAVISGASGTSVTGTLPTFLGGDNTTLAYWYAGSTSFTATYDAGFSTIRGPYSATVFGQPVYIMENQNVSRLDNTPTMTSSVSTPLSVAALEVVCHKVFSD